MNKTELINAIAENAGLNKADAKKALDATISAISEALKKGDKIALVGFGTFSVNERPARTGINLLPFIMYLCSLNDKVKTRLWR